MPRVGRKEYLVGLGDKKIGPGRTLSEPRSMHWIALFEAGQRTGRKPSLCDEYRDV